jgi:hypothetical protein
MLDIIFILTSQTLGFVFEHPNTANATASYIGNPAGPNSPSIFSIATAIYSMTFGLLAVRPYFAIPFITKAGDSFSHNIRIIS